MDYDQRYNQALGYMLDLYTDNHIVDSITTEQFKELFDMFIDSKKDIDRILYGDEARGEIVQLPNGEFRTRRISNSLESKRIAQDICDHTRDVLNNM
ncbi:hypothetical protein FDF69_20305 [Clostridium sporogenes]|uniref:hypothetical protein n=1 Tax=Clostridium sporogenes TaxID=1509 RepID=UPI000717A804|nr:hypothetical protein [Clostridium sporogenes]KRU46298.1 hypothetical protein VT94_04720 [Clostridium sporogenes]MBY7064373.1 hypothetical protein [Clostridium sporogenes]MBY7071369.1 hypothetical protein [Clostridium sporogenes]MCW6064804.1 hypothetical protein [Clostridium sporogenes]NFF69430.1 hypothetical protein [Clostridium sporogenes]